MERPFVIFISKFHKPVAIVPVLEVSNFTKLNFDADIIEWQDNDGFQNAFNKALEILGDNFVLGIEGQLMRAFEMQAITNASKNVVIKNAHKIISQIRLHKEEYEINNLTKAVEVAEQALNNTLDFVKEGLTEVEIKSFLMQQLLKFGAQGIAFEPLVLAGSNSALCHGHSRQDYKIKNIVETKLCILLTDFHLSQPDSQKSSSLLLISLAGRSFVTYIPDDVDVLGLFSYLG